jgi:hypothetical protein
LGPAGPSSLHAAFMTADGPPLTERQIVDGVCLLSPAQAMHMGPFFVLAQRGQRMANLMGDYKVVVCVWPDHVAAVLAFDPTLARPRAKQLVRSYYLARAGMSHNNGAQTNRNGGEPC